MSLILNKIGSSKADCDYLYGLQSIENIRAYSLNKKKPTYEEHLKWFNEVSGSITTTIYKLVLEESDVGMIRIDDLNQGYGIVSIIIDPLYSGRGIAKEAIKMLINSVDLNEFRAVIHRNNIASIKAFSTNEFIFFKKMNDSFDIYKRFKI